MRCNYTLSLTAALDGGGGGGQRYVLADLPPGKRAGWAVVENLALTGFRSPDCTAHSEWLYRLSYAGPLACVCASVCLSRLKCVCSLSYLAFNTHALCCHPWPSWLYHIFPHYLIKRHEFREKVIDHKNWCFDCLVILSETFIVLDEFSETLLQVSMQGTHYSCQILMKLEFSRQIFEAD